MKTICLKALCVLLLVENSVSLDLPVLGGISTLIPPTLIPQVCINAPCPVPANLTQFVYSSLTNCSLPQADSSNKTSTVSSGLIALRFYNGNDANTSVEVLLPLASGTVITNLPGFDRTKKTLFYFHGYTENINRDSVHRIVNAYLSCGDDNVFVVDWSSISIMEYPLAAAGCTTTVAEQAGDAIQQLIDTGYPKDDIEVVAHSLGAQCAGAMGRTQFDGSLPLIVGLDPAGPLFTCIDGLQKGDALFVPIVHTDRAFYGSLPLLGDFNVMLNRDGFRLQPGCPCVFPPLFISSLEGCSHHFSWEVYASSVCGSAQFLCAKCNCYTDFQSHNCDKNPLVALYGASTSSRGNCYMQTSGQSPYGLGAAGAIYSGN